MANIKSLDTLEDWELENSEQDIRGWDVVEDPEERVVGHVRDLRVNTDTELVEEVELDNGQVLSAESIDIHDGRVHIRSQAIGGRNGHARQESIVKVYRDHPGVT